MKIKEDILGIISLLTMMLVVVVLMIMLLVGALISKNDKCLIDANCINLQEVNNV